jgi:Holliday junction resolvase-like predicted endonuclease
MVALSSRASKGSRAYARGSRAKDAARAALVRDGWTVLDRRVRTQAGEMDVLPNRTACSRSSK